MSALLTEVTALLPKLFVALIIVVVAGEIAAAVPNIMSSALSDLS